MATTGINPDGSERSRLDQLPRVAYLASWPTTTATDAERRGTLDETTPNVTLNLAAQFVAWPTPNTMTGGQTSRSGDRIGELLMGGAVALCAWPTPQASDGSGGGQAKRATNPDRSSDLMDFAMLLRDLEGPARLTASGAMLIGSDAGTRNGGQLSPAHSLWLMLGPFATAWASCGERVTRSRSAKRRGSSSPSAMLSSSTGRSSDDE